MFSFVWFIWFVLFVWLNQTDRMNQMNQMNQIDQTNHRGRRGYHSPVYEVKKSVWRMAQWKLVREGFGGRHDY